MNVEISEHFSKHAQIDQAFKALSCEALSDMVKFYVTQDKLADKKKNKDKLNLLSHLVLSRLIPTIDSFQKDEATKHLDTGFNWNVILGQISPVASTLSSVHTSHSVNINSNRCDILFYQKMQCNFLLNGKPRKVECVVYCQIVKEVPFALESLWRQAKETDWLSLDILQYIFFFSLIIFFFVSSRVCRKYSKSEELKPDEQMTLKD